MDLISIRRLTLILVPLLAIFSSVGHSQEKSTLGDGYILIAPINSSMAYLVNHKKEVVHQWNCQGSAGNSTYLLKDGTLLRTGVKDSPNFYARGGAGGNIKKIAWDGTVLWNYDLSNDQYRQHHDVEPMPNGNVLVIAWEYRSRQEAIDAGRNPETLNEQALWPETVIELKPKGKSDAEVVWQWRLWDHLVQDFDKSKKNFGEVWAHPELVDLNFGVRRGGADWIHMNSIAYNATLDQIAMSARWFDEVWIIDHSTTTQEATGHSGGKCRKGGDLIYRWGNPQSYFAGLPIDRVFFAQHDLRWIPEGFPGAGNLLLFNNGDRRDERNYSSVDEFVPPLKEDGTYELPRKSGYGPTNFIWTYSEPRNFVSNRISGAERLPSGNTLICSGDQSWIFEVTPSGEKVWELIVEDLLGPGAGPRGPVFRAPFYAVDYPAFRGKKLNQK